MPISDVQPADRGTPSVGWVPMGNKAGVVPYLLVLVAAVVGSDILFFRHQFWPRLMANVGIVLVVGAFALRYRSTHGG